MHFFSSLFSLLSSIFKTTRNYCHLLLDMIYRGFFCFSLAGKIAKSGLELIFSFLAQQLRRFMGLLYHDYIHLAAHTIFFGLPQKKLTKYWSLPYFSFFFNQLSNIRCFMLFEMLKTGLTKPRRRWCIKDGIFQDSYYDGKDNNQHAVRIGHTPFPLCGF